MAVATEKDESACPVDHKTRDAWLAQAKNQSACPADHPPSSQTPSPKTWTQTITSYLPWLSSSSSSSPPAQSAPATNPISSKKNLDTNRVISTIPRSVNDPEACPVDRGATTNAANHEIESGVDASGNWVYPSEKMFFDAMKRKGYDARVADMKTVVPIHNAVNERAWREIKEWEAPYLSKSK